MSASDDQPMQQTGTDQRIAELEILIMQHEDSIESLSSTMHRQQQLIEQLNLSVQVIAERMKTLQDESAVKPQEEEVPPPHY